MGERQVFQSDRHRPPVAGDFLTDKPGDDDLEAARRAGRAVFRHLESLCEQLIDNFGRALPRRYAYAWDCRTGPSAIACALAVGDTRLRYLRFYRRSLDPWGLGFINNKFPLEASCGRPPIQ